MNLFAFFVSASAVTIVIYSLISLIIKNRTLGLEITWKFILLVVISLIALIFQNMNSYLAVFGYILSQFILVIILYYSYLKSAFYEALLLPLDLIREVVIIISLYLSLFMTLSFLEKKHFEKKGNWIVFTSLIILDTSFMFYVFYLIFAEGFLGVLSYITFDFFIIWFFSPFVLPSEITYEKE